jgi:hypothetical protein
MGFIHAGSGCQYGGTKIGKDVPRFGEECKNPDEAYSIFMWEHVPCITPQQARKAYNKHGEK